MVDTLDWAPFVLCPPERAAPRPRSLAHPQGLGDRMRTAAFAEKMAVHAFAWAAERFDDAPGALRAAWAAQVDEERLHHRVIVERMAELGFALDGRPVSDRLWRSLRACSSGRDFCIKIASAEERGRQAGLALCRQLGGRDPRTAAIFTRIVDDEVAHVALARRFYGWTPPSAVE